MNRHNLVIIKPWRWYLPWIAPKFGIQLVKPVNNLWPKESFVSSADAETLEVMNEALQGSLDQTSKELIKLRES